MHRNCAALREPTASTYTTTKSCVRFTPSCRTIGAVIFCGSVSKASIPKYSTRSLLSTRTVPVEPVVDVPAAALVGCRVSTAYRGVIERGRLASGEVLAVHGCGGVGLAAIAFGRALGAQVVAVDISPDALALAEEAEAEAAAAEALAAAANPTPADTSAVHAYYNRLFNSPAAVASATTADTWAYYNIDNGPVENHAAITAVLAAGSQGPALVGTVDDFDGDGFMEIGSALSDFMIVADLQEPTAACPAREGTRRRHRLLLRPIALPRARASLRASSRARSSKARGNRARPVAGDLRG